MTTPVRTTLLFGLCSAILAVPVTSFLTIFLAWSMALNIFVALNLVLYSFLLCRWTATRPLSLAFPLLLATGIALWPESSTAFLLAALWLFVWIRSGACIQAMVIRKIHAELITVLGGAGFLLFWSSDAPLALPVVTWFFFLVQSLYFIIIPDTQQREKNDDPDQFELARREMERIFRAGKID